ncbi:MAG: fatty acid desaturase CarF family protein [Anaerolineaceae bacterium]
MSVCANFAVAVFCGFYLVFHFDASGLTWLQFLGALLLGYFFADFASGLVHWGIDTWFDERVVFDRAVTIAREHHTHPQNIFGYGFLEHSTLGSAPSAVVVGLASLVTGWFPVSPVVYSLMTCWWVTSTCLFFGTSFHNLGHRRTNSPFIRLLQKLHIVITPQHHLVHHRNDQTVHYCVINGWANGICDRFQVWRGLEWFVHALTGAEPRQDDLEWQRRFRETGTLTRPSANSSQSNEVHTARVGPPAREPAAGT